jgi:hypothetical protein
LGIRKATLKASVKALAPNIEAMSNSRTNPVTRETKVNIDTTEADRKRLTVAECSGLLAAQKQLSKPNQGQICWAGQGEAHTVGMTGLHVWAENATKLKRASARMLGSLDNILRH